MRIGPVLALGFALLCIAPALSAGQSLEDPCIQACEATAYQCVFACPKEPDKRPACRERCDREQDACNAKCGPSPKCTPGQPGCSQGT